VLIITLFTNQKKTNKDIDIEVDKIVTRKGGLNCDPLKINSVT